MSNADITELIARVRERHDNAADELFNRVYRELRQLAAHYMQNERREHTLQPTALVHEAYVRLIGQHDLSSANRAHFFGVAANVMRRVLIDHARTRRAEKRGGGQGRIPLEDAPDVAAQNLDSLVEIDEALERLASLDARQARIVELRFFGGLSVEQTAEVLGVAPRTVDRDWRIARGWLRRELASLRG